MISTKVLSKQNVCLLFLVLLFLCFSSKAGAIPINTGTFSSCSDGNEAHYILVHGKNDLLILYLHSLAGDYREPFKAENNLSESLLKDFPNSSLLSCDYGSSTSWGDAAARLDITNNLRSVIKSSNIRKIIIVGVSMGATAALTYAATAPSYIKDKITGIVAVSPCANLADLYKQTGVPEIKSSLENAFGPIAMNIPIGYAQNSLDTCIVFMPIKIKVGIISATEDKAVPLDLQNCVVRDLNNRGINTKSFEVEGTFEALPVKPILEACHFVLGQ